MAAALRILGADSLECSCRVLALSNTTMGQDRPAGFLNAAAEIVTSHTPRALLALCLDAERALKRERRERWGPRIIDIDILLYGERAVHEAGLDIPHPRMLERAFVLAPLAEIAPGLESWGRRIGICRDDLASSGRRPGAIGGSTPSRLVKDKPAPGAGRSRVSSTPVGSVSPKSGRRRFLVERPACLARRLQRGRYRHVALEIGVAGVDIAG